MDPKYLSKERKQCLRNFVLNNNNSKNIKRNLSYALVAQLISLALSVLMALIIPKLLNVEAYSFFQLFVFYSTYVGIFHFGMTDGVYLKYGGERYRNINKQLLGSQLWLMIFIQFIIAFAIILYSIIYVKVADRQFVLIATTIYILVANITWFFGFLFQAVNYTKHYSISVIINKVVYIISIVILIIIRPEDYRIFIILFVVAQTFAAAYCLILGRDIAFTKLVSFKEALIEFIGYAKIGSSLLFANIASQLIIGSGRLVVDRAWGIHAFGKLSLALSLSIFFLQFINQISMVLFPMLRRSDERELRHFYTLSRNVLVLFLPLIFLAYAPIKTILGLWLPEYVESFWYLAILLPICTFDGKMNLLCNTYFKVLRKEKVLLLVNLITMLIAFILSLIGAYIIRDIYVVIIFMVVAIAFRSIVSEIFLARLMGTKVIYSIIQEVLLTIIFVFCSLKLNTIKGFFVFLLVYIVYLLLNWSKINSFLELVIKRKH